MTERRLVDLRPSWCGAGGEGVFTRGENDELIPVPERTGVGITFECPCGCDQRAFIGFENPLDGKGPHDPREKAQWRRTGDTFETLTLRPSIQRVHGCRWHGFLTDGEFKSC